MEGRGKRYVTSGDGSLKLVCRQCFVSGRQMALVFEMDAADLERLFLLRCREENKWGKKELKFSYLHVVLILLPVLRYYITDI
ncbi:hypothetical protein TNCT_408431 [Trichonephila clavata]|uniref:Uncharacterized protein n=1 Tax=Trichonephila clavata TaxID=2740835 RepID=A0A8X6FYQ0_TRICU|nr:hypothetical protein TNCT_408431 [Trichonephila clavata]